MSNLVLHEPLATEVRRIAQAEGVTAESVVEAALRHYRALARQKKIKAEAEWWASAPAEVRAQYAAEYVAIHQRQVVDHDADENALFDRMQRQFPGIACLSRWAQDALLYTCAARGSNVYESPLYNLLSAARAYP